MPDRNSLHSVHETNASVRFYQLLSLSEFDSLSIEDVFCRWGERNSSLDISLDESGKPYPNKAPGVVFLSYPAFKGLMSLLPQHYVPMHWLLNMLSILMGILPLLVVCGVLARWMQTWWGNGGALLFIPLCLLGTPLFVYAGLFQDYGLGIALFLSGAYCMVRATRFWQVVLAGLLLGFAGTVNYLFFVYGAVAGLVCLVRRYQDGNEPTKTVLGLLAGGIFPLGLVLAYHTWIWGDPFSTPYEHLMYDHIRVGMERSEFQWKGLMQSLFGTKLGVFFFMPWGVLGLWGLWKGTKTQGEPGIWSTIGLGVTVVGVTFSTYWVATNPDAAAFNRHLSPLFPFWAYGLLSFFYACPEGKQRGSIWVGIAAGTVGISVIYAWVTGWSFPYHPAIFRSPIWELNFPLFFSGAHVIPFHWNPMDRLGFGSPDGNWGAIGWSFLFLVGAFLAAVVTPTYSERALRRILRILLIGVLVFSGFILLGLWTDPVSQQDRRENTSLAEMQRRVVNEKFMVVGESYRVPDGWGWNPAGYLKNPWCHVNRETK